MQEHDPYTFALNEIRAHDQGRRRWPAGERERRLELLRAEEAQELAWGLRHLTIIYGEIHNDRDEQALDDVVCIALDAFDGRWHRLTGVPARYLTVTISGPDASPWVDLLASHWAQIAPHHWQILHSAVFVDRQSVR